MFPSTSPETGRDSWADGPRTGPAGPAPGPAPRGGYPPGPGQSGMPYDEPPVAVEEEPELETGRRRLRGKRGSDDPVPGSGLDPDTDDEDEEEIEPVPIRRPLALAVAGFAGLLGLGLVFGAQTSGPGARVPFALVVFGVQLLYILAWTMAMRPPALPLVAGVSVAVAAGADVAAIVPDVAALGPVGFVAVAGFVAGVLGQLVRRTDRARVTESLGATLLIVIGVVAFASLIVLSRLPIGTQAIFVCLGGSGVALVVARLTDAVLPWPRLAPQVPRGAAGVVLGAMLGTLASSLIGGYVVGFTPTSGAIVGLVAATAAVLADLGVGYSEAGRLMAGEPPTMWVARHMQGPLGGFALAAPAAYAMSVFFL
ncbi:hypothetical protein [Micromonospora sp. NBC_01796]|uniref:hypothetical protein n=1 Tax=Micromonospora sp. NBC_01796 TaxID=2975987 RepID=UPI002DD7C1D5|nr:hypothetical protein [Micromonospora sp. NBC_01796]WSA89028.1 hypothetical protein OIE47_16235 [Micromonospora sp. NBC_01796]